MALKLLKQGESSRMVGYIFWIEDLEKSGKTYGDLIGYLEDCGAQCVCSPIHDRDHYTAQDVKGWIGRHDKYIDADTGEIAPEYTDLVPKVGALKKAHIHIYFRSKGPKKGPQWAEILEDFMPVDPRRFVKVVDWDYIVRYCAHMDAPTKAPYDPLTVLGFGNADISALMGVNKCNKYAVIREVNDYIKKSRITTYRQLNNWALSTGDIDIINCVTSRVSYFCAIFADIRNAKKERAEKASS